MARVAIVADSHFDEHSRFEECVRVHDWIAEDIARRGVDVVLHAGDVFERKSTPRERQAVAAWLIKCAEGAPVVIVRGNHDPLGDLAIFAKLRTKHPITVEEAAGMHVVGGVAVACLAWPRKAELVARMAGRLGDEEVGTAAREALRLVLSGFRDQFEALDGWPRVLLTHAMVSGSVTSTGQPLVGCDMELGLEDLALAGADLTAIGHIHKGQDWRYEQSPFVYPGSPRRTAFGEVEPKGYVYAEIDGLVSWERIETPATPMFHIEATWAAGSWIVSSQTAFATGKRREGEFRFRYTVDADSRDAARAAAEEQRARHLADGATFVKVEEVVRATTRARAPEVASAQTLPEKLRAYWPVRGIELSEERQARVLGRLSMLEGGA